MKLSLLICLVAMGFCLCEEQKFDLTCPHGPFNVANKAITVVCQVNVVLNSNIGIISATAKTDPSVSYLQLDETINVYNGQPRTTYSGTLKFTLPQYAPNGTWFVTAYAQDVDYTTIEYAPTRSFVIKATTNDLSAPTINSISVSTWTVNPCGNTNYVTLSVSDALSGVDAVSVFAEDPITHVPFISEYLTFSPPFNGPRVITVAQSAASGPPLKAGERLTLTVSLRDSLLNQQYFYSSSGELPSINVVSSGCAAGQYASNSSSGCLQCPANLYSNNGSFSCCACPPGTVLSGPNQCTPCPGGYYGNGGANACSKCPAGSYTYYSGSAVCTPCGNGYTSTPGSTTCTSCSPGTSSFAGDATCTKCPKGTHSTSGLQCTKCTAGTYASSLGQSTCALCPLNTFSTQTGASSCVACPSGKTSPPGSNSLLNCM